MEPTGYVKSLLTLGRNNFIVAQFRNGTFPLSASFVDLPKLNLRRVLLLQRTIVERAVSQRVLIPDLALVDDLDETRPPSRDRDRVLQMTTFSEIARRCRVSSSASRRPCRMAHRSYSRIGTYAADRLRAERTSLRCPARQSKLDLAEGLLRATDRRIPDRVPPLFHALLE